MIRIHIYGSGIRYLEYNLDLAVKIEDDLLDEFKNKTAINYELFASEYFADRLIELKEGLIRPATFTVQGDLAKLSVEFDPSVNDYFDIIKYSFDEKNKYNGIEVEDLKFDIDFDLSNPRDLILGKTFFIYAKYKDDIENDHAGSSYIKEMTIYPYLKPVEKVELIDEETGCRLVTDTNVLPKNAKLVRDEIVDTSDSYDAYTLIHDYVDGTSKNSMIYAWHVKVGNKEKKSFVDNIKMMFKIPEDWDGNNVQMISVLDGIGWNPQETGEIEEIDGEKFFVVKSKVLGSYGLYEFQNFDGTGENLADGTYSIPISVFHFDIEGRLSMANKCLSQNVKLVVKDGSKRLYPEFKGIEEYGNYSYMSKMWVYEKDYAIDQFHCVKGDKDLVKFIRYYRNEDGSLLKDSFNKDSYFYYPKEGYINLPSDEAMIPVRFRVPVMDEVGGGDFSQDAWLAIAWNEAKKLSEEAEEEPIKMALTELISVCETVNKDEFNDKKWEAFVNELNNAKNVINNENSNFEDLLRADNRLQRSMDDLISGDSNYEEGNDVEDGTVYEGLDYKNLSDGVYDVDLEMKHYYDPNKLSMANSAVKRPVKVVVKDGKYYLELMLQPIKRKFEDDEFKGYLGTMQYENSVGEFEDVEILEYYDDIDDFYEIFKKYMGEESPKYPKLIRYPIPKPEDKVQETVAKVFVPIMESLTTGLGEQKCKPTILWKELKESSGSYYEETEEESVDIKKEKTPLGKMPTMEYTMTEKEAISRVSAYRDVEENWAKPYIIESVRLGLFKGTSKSTFSPMAKSTRGMLFNLLHTMSGDAEEKVEGKWYASSMKWAKEKGISDGLRPEAEITRQEIVSMLYRYVGEPKTEQDLSMYEDSKEISSWAMDAMKWAVEKKLIYGRTEKLLAPTGKATRAELAAILLRFLGK